jgi:hypothetical protein
LEIPTDPAQRTDDDQELLMQTEDIVETWRQEAIQEGIQQRECSGLALCWDGKAGHVRRCSGSCVNTSAVGP